MLKLVRILVVLLFIGAGVWYFFIKEYDYKITFKTKQAPGIVYHKLLGWNNWQVSNKAVKTHNKEPYSLVSQELNVSDSIFEIDWYISRTSDSLTIVNAHLSDVQNSLVQKLKAPFIKTDFVKRSLFTVMRIQSDLAELNKKYKVGKIQKSIIPEQFCAYISLESKIEEKANQMMVHNFEILTYLQDNNIEIVGSPFLEVTNWDETKGTLSFDFCFPIPSNENIEDSDNVNFKKTKKREALKTIFNGNYRISDCAWFSIIDYAQGYNIELEKLPTEIFLNDPHYGGNELDWEAEIYIPIKTSN